MKLKTFDAQMGKMRNAQLPLIHLTLSGLVTINGAAVEALQLTDKSQVKLHQDLDHKTDWYLEIVTANGFSLRKNKTSKAGSLMFGCSTLTKAVIASVGKTKAIKVPLATHTVEGKYYALLTSALK